MAVLVELEKLGKSFKNAEGAVIEAVKSVDLQINKGEIFSLLGPNGAGKTTTISMMAGLLSPSRGDARIGGYSITQQPMQAKALLGVVPQEIALYPTLSAYRNLEFFGRMYNMSGESLRRRIDEVLELIGLADRKNDKVETFSGGMKRRVNIGVGLLHKPQLVYMDEPTVGVDPQSRRSVLDMVYRLRDEYGMTVLYTTHLMEEAQELSDRVGIIDHGEIIALGTVGELVQQIGEEDKLVFNVGNQIVPDVLLRQLEQQVEGVTHATFTPSEGFDESALVTISARRGRRAMAALFQLMSNAGLEISSVEVREPDLEAVFLNLTGRALRD